MIVLRNKYDNTKSLLIGLSQDDEKVLQFIYDNNIMWGFYQLIHINESNKLAHDMVKKVISKFPSATAIAFLSCPEGYVPKYDKVER